MPRTLPPTAVGFPNLAMSNIPAADEQAAVIEQVKAMAASPDPAARAIAQQYMDKFGRNLLAVGLDRATRSRRGRSIPATATS
jgi:hypothetical protein